MGTKAKKTTVANKETVITPVNIEAATPVVETAVPAGDDLASRLAKLEKELKGAEEAYRRTSSAQVALKANRQCAVLALKQEIADLRKAARSAEAAAARPAEAAADAAMLRLHRRFVVSILALAAGCSEKLVDASWDTVVMAEAAGFRRVGGKGAIWTNKGDNGKVVLHANFKERVAKAMRALDAVRTGMSAKEKAMMPAPVVTPTYAEVLAQLEERYVKAVEEMKAASAAEAKAKADAKELLENSNDTTALKDAVALVKRCTAYATEKAQFCADADAALQKQRESLLPLINAALKNVKEELAALLG
jgi:phage regulator Rha-like protein